jgi:putative transposase
MPNTYTQLYIHLIFALKGREGLIKESLRVEIEKYITGIVQNKKHKLLAIYCMPDHAHILLALNPNQSISDLVKEIKVSCTLFINENFQLAGKFYWQEGYGAFSYAKSQLDNVIGYIMNQEEHHKKKSFRDEYISFLQKFEVEYKDEYLFEFYERQGQ